MPIQLNRANDSCLSNVLRGYGSPVGGAACAKRRSRDLRIAIIGAGVAGLSAAQRLKDLGYSDITIYEKEDRVGGKVLSYRHKGRVYELGALWSSGQYKVINALAARFGHKTYGARLPDVLKEGESFSYRRYFLTHPGLRASMLAFVRLVLTYFKYPSIRSSRRVAVDRAMRLNFREFSRREGIAPIAEAAASFIAGCGYGPIASVSALSSMKLVFVMVGVLGPDVLGLSKSRARIFENGWQRLFETMAEQFDVRLSSPPSEVRRLSVDGRLRIEVVARGKTESYDRLIVAMPLATAGTVLRLTAEEKDLFAMIRTQRFRVTLVEGERLVHASFGDHAAEGSVGHVNMIVRGDPDHDVHLIYQRLDDTMTDEEADTFLYQDVAAIGGKITAVVTSRTWAYFPHVSEDDEGQFFERMESFQGLLGSYFVGSLMNFETVEHTARYSVALVDRCFA